MDTCDCCNEYKGVLDALYEVWDFYGVIILCAYCYAAECDEFGYHLDCC